MAILNLQNLTLNPQEISDFKQIIMKSTMENPAITALHNVQEGVKMKSQIVLADKLGLNGLKSTGCARVESTAMSTLTQKYWEPSQIEGYFEICQAEVDGLFKAYSSKIKSFKDLYEIEGSDEAMFVANLISQAASDTIMRAIWFGDSNVAAATASTAGLVDGTNTVYFDYFDGIFAQIFAGVAGGSVKRTSLASITTSTVTAAQAYSAFMSTYKSASPELRSNPEAKFYVTGQMYLGLVEYLQTESVNFTIDNTLNGFETIKFLGKNVVNCESIFDSTMQLFNTNSTDGKVLFPHRIVFTTPANIPVGTLSAGDFENVEIWYDQNARLNKMAYGMTLDAKVLDETLITVAY